MTLFREYAIDPTAIGTLSQLITIWRETGVSEGRVIANFPDRTNWLRLAGGAIDSNLGASAIAELLKQDRGLDKFVNSRKPFKGDPGQWMDRVLKENSRTPFHAVVGRSQGLTSLPENWVEIDDITSRVYPPKLWRKPTSHRLAANNPEISLALGSFVRISRVVQIIDPYFLPGLKSMGFLNWVSSQLPQKSRIIVHTIARKQAQTRSTLKEHRATIKEQFRKALKDQKHDVTLNVYQPTKGRYRWHSRYLLNDMGGFLATDSWMLDGREIEILPLAQEDYQRLLLSFGCSCSNPDHLHPEPEFMVVSPPARKK